MKKFLQKIGKALLIGSLIFPLYTKPTANSKNPNPFKDTRKIIILDPGHGMSNQELRVIDWGAIYKQNYEVNIVLEQAKNIEDMLNPLKYKVILTRNSITMPTTLESRPELANKLKADMFISLHLNNYKRNYVRGFEVFYRNDTSKNLATLAAKNLRELPTIKRRLRKKDFLMLKDINCPAILIESGYLSSPKDRKYILDTIPDIERIVTKTIEQYFQPDSTKN